MTVTFGQAKRSLARYTGSAGLADVGAAINAACEELSFSDHWRDLRKTLRLAVSGGVFALPQEYDTLLRACVNGRPVPLYGSDIEFLSSGPGDFDYVPHNRAPVNGVQDLGRACVMYDPPPGSGLAFFSSAPPASGVTVRGRTVSGDSVTVAVGVNQWQGAADIDGLDPASVTKTPALATVDAVVLPDSASAYISCYAASSAFTFVSRMHPAEKVPAFRRFRIPGASAEPGYAYDIYAEARLKFLPLIADSDPMPFETLLPVQYMLRSLAKADADDLDGARKFRDLAVASLALRENIHEERQGVVVLNSLYDGSPGQQSSQLFYNI